MDSSKTYNYQQTPPPLTLFPSTRSVSNSPEFEFWNISLNPSSFPQQNLISADELFVNGVILPLHKLPNKPPDPEPETNTEPQPSSPDPVLNPESESGPQITKSESTTVLSASKRWKDLFKKGDKKGISKIHEEKDKEKKRSVPGPSSSAELNINIWPFRRSRSAGNNGTRPRLVSTATRNVSSAPCSRSNSSGESKTSRKQWPSSPGRGGVHLGRASPVWQVKRGAGSGVRGFSEPQVRNPRVEKVGVSKKNVTPNRRGKTVSSSNGGDNNKAKVLNLNVPMCIGYRHHLSCRSDGNGGAIGVVGDVSGGGSKISGGKSGSNGGNFQNSRGNVGNLFILRSLFTKKVY